MIVYSKKIIQFVNDIKSAIKDILSNEIRLKVGRDRFLDRRQRTSYPIKVVVYDNKSMLGYFDPDFYELGFHQSLMHASKQQLHQVIRHEIAHYITFITYGSAAQPHGNEFKVFCKQMGWGEEIYRATICIDGAQNTPHSQESGVLRKVQKLMALTTSSNTHEAEAAMMKSRQFLLKHNIDAEYIGGEDDEKVCLKRIMKQKRESAKMRSIARILETFFVSTVYSRGGEFIYLEILGNAVNVEIAEYVAGVLDSELDNLWTQAQRQANLRGAIARNSFFLGLARGYCNKIQALKREYTSEITRALMVIEKQLVDARAMAYPRLSTAKSSARYCKESSILGEQMGRQLNINPAIDNSTGNSEALLLKSIGKR
jgi:Protein of unknown function (DUF2786)/SprT-like family